MYVLGGTIVSFFVAPHARKKLKENIYLLYRFKLIHFSLKWIKNLSKRFFSKIMSMQKNNISINLSSLMYLHFLLLIIFFVRHGDVLCGVWNKKLHFKIKVFKTKLYKVILIRIFVKMHNFKMSLVLSTTLAQNVLK